MQEESWGIKMNASTKDGYIDGLAKKDKRKGMLHDYDVGYSMGKAERLEADNQDANKLTSGEYLATVSEMTAYESATAQNMKLREHMMETRQSLNNECVLIIDAMELAFDSKKESLDKLRDYKASVVREVSEVTAALCKLKELTSDKLLKEQTFQLKEFLSVCERLKELQESGFLSGITSIANALQIK